MLLTASISTFYGPVINNFETELTSGIASGTTTIPVDTTAGCPSSGVISIGDEVIYYASKTSVTFDNCIRAFDGTSAAAYSQGAVVELRWVATHHNSLATEIIGIESTLGSTISSGLDGGSPVDYDSVNERISTFESTKSVAIPPFPATARVGATHYVSSMDEWYIHDGLGAWSLIAASTLSSSSDDWDLVTHTPSYISPKIVSIVNVAEAALFITSTLSDYVSSFDGFGMLGREGETLAFKTKDNEIATIITDDRIAQPYLMSFNIDNPVTDEISTFIVVPDGTRNIRKLYAIAAGNSGFVQVNVSKISTGDTLNDAFVLATIGVSLVNSITPAFNSLSLGTWDTTNYSISPGDIVYSRVTSVSGSVDRITTTIEAPFFIA